MTITVYANQSIIGSLENVTMSSQNTTTLVIVWNTTTFTMGNYTINATISSISGETDLSDNTYVYYPMLITIAGDFDGDQDVDIYDIVMISGAYDTTEGEGRYDCTCDIDGDGDIDIYDVVIAADNYLESW